MSFHLCGESLAYTVVWQEIMAIMVALSTFAEEIQGRKVILYSDNKGAPSRLCVFASPCDMHIRRTTLDHERPVGVL